MLFPLPFGPKGPARPFRQRLPRSVRLFLESLEARVVPYNISGNAWPHPELVTVSFMPDNTIVGSNGSSYIYSNLFATMNAKWSTATWQAEIIKGLQLWAQGTNLNFDIVSDNGASIGSGSNQQGDSGYGDIRIGGYAFTTSYLATANLPPPVTNYSLAGDILFNTKSTVNWKINQDYDLQTVAIHEVGHALGMDHNNTRTQADMYPNYNGQDRALDSDDASGIQAVYSGSRSADSYDAAASNGTFGTATSVSIDSAALTGLVSSADITTTSDLDYFAFTAPSDTTGTLNVKVQTAGLSLLRQSVTVYASNQTTVLGSGSSAGAMDGTTVSISVSGVSAGQVFYVKVAGADTTAFGTGKYGMTINFGTGADPTIPLPNTTTANGSPLTAGGGGYEQGWALDRIIALLTHRGLDPGDSGFDGLEFPTVAAAAQPALPPAAPKDSRAHLSFIDFTVERPTADLGVSPVAPIPTLDVFRESGPLVKAPFGQAWQQAVDALHEADVRDSSATDDLSPALVAALGDVLD